MALLASQFVHARGFGGCHSGGYSGGGYHGGSYSGSHSYSGHGYGGASESYNRSYEGSHGGSAEVSGGAARRTVRTAPLLAVRATCRPPARKAESYNSQEERARRPVPMAPPPVAAAVRSATGA